MIVSIKLSCNIRYHRHQLNLTTKIEKKIISVNPSYNQSVSTNLSQTFLKLIDKHLPCLQRLYKILKLNTIKVSYSCTDNMEQHVKKHNIYVQQKKEG